jgi:tRNA modification GTPase
LAVTREADSRETSFGMKLDSVAPDPSVGSGKAHASFSNEKQPLGIGSRLPAATTSSAPDTIFALSSGRLPSGVAVIRVSGPDSLASAKRLTGRLPHPRTAALRVIRAFGGDVIDRGLVIVFAKPASFTGEDSVEYHLHGGPAVVAAMLETLSGQDNHRLAEAGEFSKRAFLNGKADLTELEALSDLVNAETEAQRRLAVAQASGHQRTMFDEWRGEIVRMRALIEADLDFSDEQDVPGSVAEPVRLATRVLRQTIALQASRFRSGEIIRDGFRVVLAGPPNSGKSSLLNALAGRDAAIVSEIAGTTRDLVEVALDIDGFKVILTDTAGLRDTIDRVEAIGIDRAKMAAGRADLVLWLGEGGCFDDTMAPVTDGKIVRVATKSDLGLQKGGSEVAVSVADGSGMSELLSLIGRSVSAAVLAGGDGLLVSRERQRKLLVACLDELDQADGSWVRGLEFAADHLRRAGDCLGRITGRIDAEEVLGEIFSGFCIGK